MFWPIYRISVIETVFLFQNSNLHGNEHGGIPGGAVHMDDREKTRHSYICLFLALSLATQGRQRLQGFLPQLDEFYFTTPEKKILENCRCIVPNFMND